MITLITIKTDELAEKALETLDDTAIKFPENQFFTNKAIRNWVIMNAEQMNADDAVIITGSEHVLNMLRLLVKNKKIDNKDIRIKYYSGINKRGKLIHNEKEQIRIMTDGSLNYWPDGFFDDWNEELRMLLRR